jgi:hypothetical protein
MTSTVTAQPGQQQQQQQSSGPGLPPTGLQQQLNSMRQQYEAYRNARVPGLGSVGVDVTANARNQQNSLRGGLTGSAQPQQAMQAQGEGGSQLPMGQTSLQQLAQRLASSYGLSVGRDQLVDAQGNFNFTPDQMAGASGGRDTMGTAAAKMNYIASAIQRQQTQDAMKKSEAALQAGLGVTSKRGRGSAVEQQQQFYSGLANLYQNQDYEAADFSYFIQKEKLDLEDAMRRRAEAQAKRKARGQMWAGAGIAIAGFASGNYAMGAQGIGMFAGGGTEAGYF